jgi:hypothetical protein
MCARSVVMNLKNLFLRMLTKYHAPSAEVQRSKERLGVVGWDSDSMVKASIIDPTRIQATGQISIPVNYDPWVVFSKGRDGYTVSSDAETFVTSDFYEAMYKIAEHFGEDLDESINSNNETRGNRDHTP